MYFHHSKVQKHIVIKTWLDPLGRGDPLAGRDPLGGRALGRNVQFCVDSRDVAVYFVFQVAPYNIFSLCSHSFILTHSLTHSLTRSFTHLLTYSQMFQSKSSTSP